MGYIYKYILGKGVFGLAIVILPRGHCYFNVRDKQSSFALI